jgi:hypothetical protein
MTGPRAPSVGPEGLVVSVTAGPTPAPQPDPDSVTPGLYGFLVVFVLAIVTWFLLRNLTGRLRRMRYREEQRLAERDDDQSS